MNKNIHDRIEIDVLIAKLEEAKQNGVTEITDISLDVRTDTYIYGDNRICGIGFWHDGEKKCIFVPFSKFSKRIKEGVELRKGSAYGRKCTGI